MNEKLTRFIFGVLLGLLPIVASWLILLLRGDAPSVVNLIAHGELLLPTASIAAAAVGELLGSRASRERRTIRLVSGGTATLVLALSCFCYAAVTSATPGVPPLNSVIVATVSLSFYVCAVVVAAACTMITATNGGKNV